MSDGKVHSKASSVNADGGEVIVDGPDGVAVSLTPDAALKTAARLKAAAERAVEQATAPDGDAKSE